MWWNFVGDIINKHYDVINVILNTFNLRRPRVTNFADIIKIATMFNKTTFKDPNKVKRIKNYVSSFCRYLYFLI